MCFIWLDSIGQWAQRKNGPRDIPQLEEVWARFGHSLEGQSLKVSRGDRIRTCDLVLPKQLWG